MSGGSFVESHKPRKAWPMKDTLNWRDMQIMESQLSGDSNAVTADKVECCTRTVQLTKRKLEYREVVIAKLAEKDYCAETYAENMIAHTKAEKTIVSKAEGKIVVADNNTRLTADMELGDIFGVKAPKQVDLKHSMAAMSDDELLKEVQRSQKEFDGRLQHSLTVSQDAGLVVTNHLALPEPAVVGAGRQQTTAPADD